MFDKLQIDRQPISNAKELNVAQISVPQNDTERPVNNNVRKPVNGLYTALPKSMNVLQTSHLRSTLEQVLPAKGLRESVAYSKGSQPQNQYQQAPMGYARGQKEGLAFDPDKPVDGPVMPIAGFFDADQLNILGGLKA